MAERGIGKVGPALTGATYAGRVGEAGEGAPQIEQGAPVEATPQEIDAATRMVLGEAGAEPDAGKAAAIHTALNRVRSRGKSLGDIIAEPNAFEAVTSGRAAKFDPESPEYRRVRDEIVIPALEGKLADPTGGALNFINLDLQRNLRRKVPKWAQRDGLKIGNHTFFGPEEERGHFASGGAVGDAEIDRLVGRLMARTQDARKAHAKSTKPLLNTPDEAVATALAVANRAI
jgi:hypothetical protein